MRSRDERGGSEIDVVLVWCVDLYSTAVSAVFAKQCKSREKLANHNQAFISHKKMTQF